MNRRTHLKTMLSTAMAWTTTSLSLSAHAASFPERPITLVVPFTAGGPTDTIARVVGEEMARTLGKAVVIDNKPGGATIIGSQLVARAKPDGYTLLMAVNGTLVTNPLLRKDLPYDADRDFDLIQMVGVDPLIAVVPMDSSVKSLEDLVAQAKAKPNQVKYASVGVGGVYHLGFELLQEITGTRMTHIPYNGSSQAQLAVIGGSVDVMFDVPTSILPQIRAGKVRPIAVTSPKRFALLPDVPAVAERYPAFESAVVWAGVAAPRGLPADVRATLKAALDKALGAEKYLQILQNFGSARVEPWSSQEISKFITSQRERWGGVIRRANVQI